MEGFMDPAGTEFDDIADGIEWAVSEKGVIPSGLEWRVDRMEDMLRRGLPLTIPNM